MAPILNRRCVECHRPGQIGPFSLATYARARGSSRRIREAVVARLMPPWFAHPDHGAWANDRSLPQKEIDTLVAWVDAGSPEGDPADAPPPPEFPGDWIAGKPDAVWRMPVEIKIPAEGTIPYKYYRVPTRLKKDRWVRSIEIHPGAREVVHHVLIFVLYPFHRLKDQPLIDGGLAGGYFGVMVPGERPTVYPEGQGKLLPAGSTILFQVHYTAVGREAWDRTRVGMRFWDAPPAHEVRTRGVFNRKIRIPAGAEAHREEATFTLRRDARLLGFLPHMHLRGSRFTYVAEYPDGRRETLLDIPRYDFNWQLFYRMRDPLKVPAGTRIRAIAVYDNSVRNPYNPDPKKEVRFGDQTWDEMLIGYMDYIEE